MPDLRDIAHRFRTGQLSLHDAALEAGMKEQQFKKAIQAFAWSEEQAQHAADIATGAAKVTRRLWDRWTKPGG